MRQSFLSLFFFCAFSSLIAQSVSINTDGSTAHSSSILEVKSTSKGMLVPRMTAAQRDAIAAPATGLLIYNTDANLFQFRNGSVWVNLNSEKILTDADGDTKIQVEEGADDDVIRFDISGDERMVLRENSTGTPRLEISDLQSNTMIGQFAGSANTTGSQNTGLGSLALSSNTTGIGNTGIGGFALRFNTTGHSNVAVGYRGLDYNTTGVYNVGVGTHALLSNTIGNYNVGVGSLSLTSNTIGSYNTAIGGDALISNVEGDYNIAVGQASLFANTSGDGNNAFGQSTLSANTTGSHNSAFGHSCMPFNTTGRSNVAIGHAAMNGNTTGSHNVGVGSFALQFDTSSQFNTAIGKSAGNDFQHGDGNTFIGSYSDANDNGYANSTALGYGCTVTASHQVRVGNTDVTSIGGFQGWTTFPSDARFKTNVRENVPGLAFIGKLRPVTYQVDIEGIHRFADLANQGKINPEASALVHTGFLAQEVEKAARELGFDFDGVDAPKNEKDLYGLRYAEFTVPLVKAVQELDAENKALKARLDALEAIVRKR